MRGDERIPIHGGPGTAGVFNAINVGNPGEGGITNVPHGSSFVQAVQFVAGACPVEPRTILTYSQSTNADVAVVLRPDADVHEQGVELAAVLRRRRGARDALDDAPLDGAGAGRRGRQAADVHVARRVPPPRDGDGAGAGSASAGRRARAGRCGSTSSA